jgi:hypothetical protein
MKQRSVLLKGLGDAVPVACGTIACTTAMLTAYEIGFAKTPLILFCVFAALLLSFWMNVPKLSFGLGLLYLAVLVLLFAVRMKRIGDGAAALTYRLLDELPKDLSELFDMEALSEKAAAVTDPEKCISLFLMMIAGVIGFILAFSLIRSKMILLPLLLPLPMLLVSLVYTNRPPALWPMALLTVYFGYALLGNGLRKGDFKHRGRFSAILAPALLALMLLIFGLFPQSTYSPLSTARRKAIFSERFGAIVDTAMSWFGVHNPRSVNLSLESEREDDDTERFTVYAKTGIYHLRTHSYGAYRNNRWRAADPYRGEWRSMAALGKRQEQADAKLWIYDSMSGERAAPYAWTDESAGDDPDEQTGTVLAEESFIRAGGWKDYGWRFTWRYRTETGGVTAEEREYYETYALKQYVMADGAEKDALLDILKQAGITTSADSLQTARMIASYVQNSGEYSLSPGDVPRGKDFILYFLTENRKGYCVHFASATTALLQAAGIPARYTVGYYVEIPQEASNHGVTVTANDEHAWTEVYVLGLGWVPVESTRGRYDDRRGDTEQPQERPDTPGQTPTPTPAPTPTPEPTEVPTEGPSEEPSEEPVQETPEPTQEPSPTPSGKTNGAEEPTPAPTGTDGNGGADEDGKRRGSAWWIVIPLIPLAWVGTGLLIRKRREARFCDPNVRRSIPDMAQYLSRMERFGVKQDPQTEEWAVEAAFSNHRMQEEHRLLLKRVHTMQRELYADRPLKRFILRWILYLI